MHPDVFQFAGTRVYESELFRWISPCEHPAHTNRTTVSPVNCCIVRDRRILLQFHASQCLSGSLPRRGSVNGRSSLKFQTSSWERTASIYTPTPPAPLWQCKPVPNVLNQSTSCVVRLPRKDKGHDTGRCFQKGILIKSASTFPHRDVQSGAECCFFFLFPSLIFCSRSACRRF